MITCNPSHQQFAVEKDQLLFFLFLLLFANTPSDSSCFVNCSEKKIPKTRDIHALWFISRQSKLIPGLTLVLALIHCADHSRNWQETREAIC